LLPVRSMYPMHHPGVLLRRLLGKRLAPGARALDQGVLVMDLQTVQHVHGVVLEGRPPVERVVALAGPGSANGLTSASA
jgi:Na+-translocating ferredoxin:NAD+ oxidoreductase RnfC subunit